MKKNTPQEKFWSGEFGDKYISRNIGSELLASNVSFFSRALKKAGYIESIVEFGANVGMNLGAIKILYPNLLLNAIEINPNASKELKINFPNCNVFTGSINSFHDNNKEQYDLSLIKTVLIHINPDQLENTYKAIYESSKKYILICEYYNTSPVTINYRGHNDRLFKRDFAGEILDKYSDLSLVDYGFVYHREQGPCHNLIDDISWFLLEKK